MSRWAGVFRTLGWKRACHGRVQGKYREKSTKTLGMQCLTSGANPLEGGEACPLALCSAVHALAAIGAQDAGVLCIFAGAHARLSCCVSIFLVVCDSGCSWLFLAVPGSWDGATAV